MSLLDVKIRLSMWKGKMRAIKFEFVVKRRFRMK